MMFKKVLEMNCKVVMMKQHAKPNVFPYFSLLFLSRFWISDHFLNGVQTPFEGDAC